jgi:hypothetical protein
MEYQDADGDTLAVTNMPTIGEVFFHVIDDEGDAVVALSIEQVAALLLQLAAICEAHQ